MSSKPANVVDSATIDLWFPVEFKEEARTISELTMRELSVNEIIEVEKSEGVAGPTEYDRLLFSKMCNVPVSVIGLLKGRDWRRLKDKYNETLGNVEPEPTTLE